MKIVLVKDNTVIEIVEGIDFPARMSANPGSVAIQVPSEVQLGWVVVNGRFQEPREASR